MTQRGLIRRLLDDNPEVRARCARRHVLTGDRLNWRRLVGARWLPADQRARIQRTLLDLIDETAAIRIIERLDRYDPSWRRFIRALARRHAAALKPRLPALLGERHPARVTIGVVGLGALAAGDPEAARMVRDLIVTGAAVENPQPIEEAVGALGRLADGESVALLSQLCRSPEAWRRQAAALALAGSRSRDAVLALLANSANEPSLITAPVAARLARRVDVARLFTARDSGLARVAPVIFRALAAGLGDVLDLSLAPRVRLAEQARAVVAQFMERPLAPVVEAVLDLDEVLARRWWPAYWKERRRSSAGATPESTAAAEASPPAPAEDDLGETLREIQALVDQVKPLHRPTVLRALIDGLHDPEEAYVLCSVRCLGRLGSETAVDPLVAVLPNLWGRLRHMVIRALGSIGEKSAAEPLIAGLRARLDERNLGPFEHAPEERQEIGELFQALCRLRGGVPLWVFRSALSEGDAATRRAAAEGLERLVARRDQDAVDLLIKTVRRDRSAAVRAAAAAGLGHASAAGAADVLVAALGDRHLAVRRAALRSLGLMRAASAADPIRSLMRQPQLKRDAALALGRISRGILPRGVLQTLIETANDPTDTPRAAEAIHALGLFDVYEAQIALEHLAKDVAADPAIREAAERARWHRTARQ